MTVIASGRGGRGGTALEVCRGTMNVIALTVFLSAINALEVADPIQLPTDVTSAFPAVETTVPVNGRLVLFGGAPADMEFVRVRGDGAEDLLEHTLLPVDQIQSAHVVTLTDLVVGETLVISSRCNSCAFTGAWTVVDADAEAPVFDDGPAVVTAEPLANDAPFSPTRSFLLNVQLPPVRDARSPVTIELRGAEENAEVNRIGPEVFGPGSPIVITADLLDGSERTLCFDAFAIDAAGNEGALDDELCVDLVPAGGCSQTSPSSAASVALALGVLALVRRRRR